MFKPFFNIVIMSLGLAGCVAGPAPENFTSSVWAPGQNARPTDHPDGRWFTARDALHTTDSCRSTVPQLPTTMRRVEPKSLASRAMLLAAGDRLRVDISGDDDMLSGVYSVQSDGSLALRGFRPLKIAGLTEGQLTDTLRHELVSSGVIRRLRSAVSVRVIESGGVPVSISGAVFAPGSVWPGERKPETRVGQSEGLATGDANGGRTLTAAIRAAAGVRPDANIGQVYLIRGGEYTVFDLRGWVGGWPVQDPILAAGDRIIVPQSNCFDPDLVRPTAITQPGIRVFMSNLTQSANNNAGAAIGEKTGSLPYGTRMLQGLVAMNCVGGSYMQSDRRGILISRNPRNGQSIVIERDIEELVRSVDRDRANPFLMPGDALACYDSRWTNFREALGLVSDLANGATPAIILGNATN